MRMAPVSTLPSRVLGEASLGDASLSTFDYVVFDLDGTLVDTEPLHHAAYNEALAVFGLERPLSFDDYCRHAHSGPGLRALVPTGVSYERFYARKKRAYLDRIDSVTLQPGAAALVEDLDFRRVPTCICTSSDADTVEHVLARHPVLRTIPHRITRSDTGQTKPHPEPYLRALAQVPTARRPVGLDDSLKGYRSLERSGMTPILVCAPDYVHREELAAMNWFPSLREIRWSAVHARGEDSGGFVASSVETYRRALDAIGSGASDALRILVPLFRHRAGNVHLAGIGKCGHICSKVVSTWRSLGIPCSVASVSDLFHGDFGAFRDGDLLLYVSSSGNTEELLHCARYVRERLRLVQVALTLRKDSALRELVDFHLPLLDEPPQEIDRINMAPTASSVVLMAALDMLGVRLAETEELTVERFQVYHPGGDLGRVRSRTVDKVVIVAAGEGTRLLPLTRYVPKILLTYRNRPFLAHLLEYWSQVCKDITIIVRSAHLPLVEAYLRGEPHVRVLSFDELTGTADTIEAALDETYRGKNILFTWCDVLPCQPLDLERFTGNLVFTHGAESRYAVDEGRLVRRDGGDVVGIYYVRGFRGLRDYELGDDVCEVFERNFGAFSAYRLEELVDIGDLGKLNKATTSGFRTRFFNEILPTDRGTVIKRAITDQGRRLMDREKRWYRALDGTCDLVPRVLDTFADGFEMERLAAIPLHEQLDLVQGCEERVALVGRAVAALELLHERASRDVPAAVLAADLRLECHEKIIERLGRVRATIDAFGPITRVNGVSVVGLDEVLARCLEHAASIPPRYAFIHGDPNFSNLLYEPATGRVRLVDPRGVFGTTELLGPPAYDHAKVVYALSGYDRLNDDDLFCIEELRDGELRFRCHERLDLLPGLSPRLRDPAVLALVIVNWLGLPQYNENNVHKCVASYYRGLELFGRFRAEGLI